MALRIIEHDTPAYRQMVALRDEILRRPLGLTFSEKDLAAEYNDILIAAFEEERMVACCVLTPEGKTGLRLRQMAVSKEAQGKGVGRAMIRFAETVARDHGYAKVTMHARATALGFYEKMGYAVSSPEFLEVTIPHYIMEKNLL